MSKAEILAVLKNDKAFQEVVNEAFTEVDKDKSGFIDRQELKVAMDKTAELFKIPKPTEDDITGEMKRLDKNNDGKISKDEFKVFVTDLLTVMAEASG